MPRFSRIRTGVLEELAEQLRFAPKGAVVKQIERALALAAELDPARTYAEDWFVRRLTGYRPDIEAPAQLVGAALLGDLSALLERLSAAARLSSGDLPTAAIPLDDLRARWKVSARTIERYRRRGLIGLRVGGDPARQRLVFPIAGVERFETNNRDLLASAGAATRIDDDTRREIVRRAGRYQRSLGISRGKAAARLASRFGRSHEAVRQLLIRAERRAGAVAPGPLSPFDRRVIFRAWRWGIEPGVLKQRYRRTLTSIHRVINERRAELLRRLDLTGPSDGAMLEGIAPMLESPSVRTGLGAPFPRLAEVMLLEHAADGAPAQKAERERARAYHSLRFEAARLIARLPRANPRPADLDAIETVLRWAGLLKAELLRDQAGHIARTLAERLGQPGVRRSPESAERWARAAVLAAAGAIDRFDPFKGGRLAAPVSLALSQALAGLSTADAETEPFGRARAVARPGTGSASSAPNDDWRARLCPWQSWLDADPRWRDRAAQLLAPNEANAVMARFGWDGGPPRTQREAAAIGGITEASFVRLLRTLARRTRSDGIT